MLRRIGRWFLRQLLLAIFLSTAFFFLIVIVGNIVKGLLR